MNCIVSELHLNNAVFFLNLFFESSHEDMFPLISERQERRKREREEGMERGREREKHQNINWLPPIRGPTGDQTHNLGVCPHRESNLQPFGAWNNPPTK